MTTTQPEWVRYVQPELSLTVRYALGSISDPMGLVHHKGGAKYSWCTATELGTVDDLDLALRTVEGKVGLPECKVVNAPNSEMWLKRLLTEEDYGKA